MKAIVISSLTIFFIPLFLSLSTINDQWASEIQQGFRLYYTSADLKNKEEYSTLIENGMPVITGFFQSPFRDKFDVFIHPDRRSLDSTWQKDWQMPDFKSECWMVASGTAQRLDMISPGSWDTEACEHVYADSVKTQQLITHELVHVFHGQVNRSPDFSDVTGMDWFIEGLATYASGQCDSARIADVKRAISENKVPERLDDFWTGKLKYGLSGTMVMYIDHKYGRKKLIGVLNFNHIDDLFESLNCSESELIDGWKAYLSYI